MAAGGRLLTIGFFGFAVAMVALFQGAAATDYTVGDDLGWTIPPNNTPNYYNDWAANKTFKTGDYLEFTSNGTHTIALVTKEKYDNCTKEVSSDLYAPPISLGLNFHGIGMYYFICTIDSHCEGGQKLAINVTVASTPTDGASDSASLSLTFGALFTIIYTSVACLLFN